MTLAERVESVRGAISDHLAACEGCYVCARRTRKQLALFSAPGYVTSTSSGSRIPGESLEEDR